MTLTESERMYLSHDIMVTRGFMEENDMSFKDKAKKIVEKAIGFGLIILGMVIGYQGVKMCTKKTYIQAEVPERKYTTIE